MLQESCAVRQCGGPVLGVVIASRYAGHACVDGFGLVPGDVAPFGTWSLRYAKHPIARANLLLAKVRRAIRRYRPISVVVAASTRTRHVMQLVDHAVRACTSVGVQASVSFAHDGLNALGWRRGSRAPDAVRVIAKHYLPELRTELPPEHDFAVHSEPWRYRRTAWQATALALRELGRIRPLSLAALVRDRPARCPLLAEIEAKVIESVPFTDPDNAMGSVQLV